MFVLQGTIRSNITIGTKDGLLLGTDVPVRFLWSGLERHLLLSHQPARVQEVVFAGVGPWVLVLLVGLLA